MRIIIAASIDGHTKYLQRFAGEQLSFRAPVAYHWTEHLSAGACWIDTTARWLDGHLRRDGIVPTFVDRKGRALSCPSCGDVSGQPAGRWCAGCAEEFSQ